MKVIGMIHQYILLTYMYMFIYNHIIIIHAFALLPYSQRKGVFIIIIVEALQYAHIWATPPFY